jgi:glycosyltransferase involved in cell wall biosynthesis
MPVRNRQDIMKYAVDSIIRQTYPLWELIIVDDNSEDNTWQVIQEYEKKDKRIKGIRLNARNQRVVARNTGMKEAKNDWILWLDSDDEYLKTYLEVLESYMNDDFPGFKCYHYGAIVVRMGYQSVRETPGYKEYGDAMERFPSGSIGCGSFCFHRSVLDKVGYLPEAINPYLFADVCKTESPEIQDWYGPPPTVRTGGSKTLGNPWGDDWYMFYKITRKFKSKGLPIAPYVQFVRRQPWSLKVDDDR